MTTTSILIADSSPLFRYGLKTVLEKDTRYEVLGEAESEEQLFDLLSEKEPDLVVMDCLASGFSIDTVLQCARVPRKQITDREGRRHLRANDGKG